VNQVERGLSVALAASLLSDAPRQGLRMGAALFTGSRLLAVGANMYTKSHPASANEKGFSRSTHCEHVCLLRRQHYDVTSKLTLYIARMRADGSLGSSKPCANCLRLCRLAGVNRIHFYNHQGKQEVLYL
jgi:deoxycytidylate deaminase